MTNGPVAEQELVSRARDGDATAYAELVRRHERLALRVAYLNCGSAEDAADATQEAFVKAYYALDRFRSGASFRPWLLRIVQNEARNRRRSAARHQRLALRAGGMGATDAPPSPEVSALDREGREALLAALNELGDRDRTVIAYRYFLDLSEAEMAAVLGVAPGTVKSRLARALERLRRRLEGEGA